MRHIEHKNYLTVEWMTIEGSFNRICQSIENQFSSELTNKVYRSVFRRHETW